MARSSFFGTVGSTSPAPDPTPLPASGDVTQAPSSFFKNSGHAYVSTGSQDPNVMVGVSVSGPPLLPDEWLFGYTFDVNVRLPENLDGSVARCGVQPATSSVLKLLKNGAQFGTVTFTAGSYEGVFSTTETLFDTDDYLEVVNSSTADANMQHVFMTLYCPRY